MPSGREAVPRELAARGFAKSWPLARGSGLLLGVGARARPVQNRFEAGRCKEHVAFHSEVRLTAGAKKTTWRPIPKCSLQHARPGRGRAANRAGWAGARRANVALICSVNIILLYSVEDYRTCRALGQELTEKGVEWEIRHIYREFNPYAGKTCNISQ